MREDPGRSATAWLSQNRVVVVLGAVAVAALAAAVFFSVMVLQTMNGEASVAPTPFPPANTATGTGSEPVVVGVSESSTVSVTLDAPAVLTIAGRQLPVQIQGVGADGIWSPPAAGSDGAFWVLGTVVNYVLGLADSDENRQLLESLAAGDEITVQTRDGDQLRFTVDSRSQVPFNQRDVFAQNTPGITLLQLGGGGDDRLVVRGQFVDDDALDAQSAEAVQLGETAQLGDLQIAVTAATYFPERPEAPDGFALYLVDFQIQNVGGSAVDSSLLTLSLTDDLGNTYAINPLASQVGNHRPLSGSLGPGQSLLATAGYQIPEGLVSNLMLWNVSRSDLGGRIQVTIPFGAGGQAGQQLVVALQTATVTPDGTSLLLAGSISNGGSQPAVVVERDLTLVGDGGAAYLLLATNPAFPWSIPGGESRPFEVAFQRPQQAAATFTLLNQPFQLTGLR